MTNTALDIDLESLIDFETEVECWVKTCSNPAEWKIQLSCCQEFSLMCTGCRVKYEKEVEDYFTIFSTLRCPYCSHLFEEKHIYQISNSAGMSLTRPV